jgi:phosphonate transport system substrate-binding protein|tara:strand:- start:2050 stop:2940 length:891 start_codon:yes stop_codon:yes gene_type:complete
MLKSFFSKTKVFAIGILASSAMSVSAVAQEIINFAITDLEGMEQLQTEFGAFKDVLTKKTGLNIKFFPVPNRTAAVEAMRNKKIDLVLTGPAEYVIFKNRTNAKPLVGFSRPDYFADIVVMADGPIQDVKDLKNKKVAMGGVGSTSKHLAPMQVMKDAGLNPLKDIKPFHTSVKVGWEALKRGDVAAFATTNDKFLKLRSKDKQFQPGAFRVIARSKDLPNDILLYRKDLDKNSVNKIKIALSENSDEMINAILVGEDNKKFTGMKFLPNTKDSDYDYVRSMYKTIGVNKFNKFVD